MRQQGCDQQTPYTSLVWHLRRTCDRLSLGLQGFCCLMQLSTRAEDFVVDALALRSHIGPLLGPIFANPEVRLRYAVGEG